MSPSVSWLCQQVFFPHESVRIHHSLKVSKCQLCTTFKSWKPSSWKSVTKSWFLFFSWSEILALHSFCDLQKVRFLHGLVGWGIVAIRGAGWGVILNEYLLKAPSHTHRSYFARFKTSYVTCKQLCKNRVNETKE